MNEEIYELIRSIDRCHFPEGVEQFISDLDDIQYFTSPASTKHHLSVPEGLVQHSINVYKMLKLLNDDHNLGLTESECLIIGLFHDLDKAGRYEQVPYARKPKDAVEDWYYKYNGQLRLGHHGTNSTVMLLQLKVEINPKIIDCINNHMGAWDDTFRLFVSRYLDSSEHSKVVNATHIADMMATKLIEGE